MGHRYTKNMRLAARRHLEAAETLYDTQRKDVAGYVFGLAAECALKELMRCSGMRPLPESDRRDDPFYAHFEDIKAMLRDRAQGRLAGRLRRYSERSDLMQYWDTSMRYSCGHDISERWIGNWRDQARDLIVNMEQE